MLLGRCAILLTIIPVALFVFVSSFGITFGSAATAFVVLAALACFCVFRAFTRWRGLVAWQRVYAVVTAGASSALLVAFIIQVAQNPMFAPKYLWAIWKIERLGGKVTVDELRTEAVWVYLDGPQVTDADLAHLEAIPRLRSLSLLGTPVSDTGLVHVQRLSDLHFLNLAYTNVTDGGLLHLQRLGNLESLDLRGTKLTNEGVKNLQRALPNCKIEWEPPTKDERQRRASPDQPSG